MDNAFYVKCRPQWADAQQIALKHNRVFIGYPAWKEGAEYDRHAMRKCLLDISMPDSKWSTGKISSELNKGYLREITANRNFVRETSQGDYVVLPRPGEGVCYVGRVDAPFEIVNDPPWADEYLGLRVQQKLGEMSREHGLDVYRGVSGEKEKSGHVADVVQCWHVERWVSIAFPLLPRWISYSLLSRNTKGWLCDRPDGKRTAWQVLDEIYRRRYAPDPAPTSDHRTVSGRMLDWLSPDAFEHLVCELLQLEQPEVRWWHIGGSGDGGADALAIDDQGRIVAALQCEWKFTGDAVALASDLKQAISSKWGRKVRVYVAVLYGELPTSKSPDVVFLDRRTLADLVLAYADRCGIAQTLRVTQKHMVVAKS